MNKRYDYCCLFCWHTWRSENKYTCCPKCKGVKLDIRSEVVI
jgi:Zn finger protein HypA/HybF involved in hydrogenase expression